MSKTVEIRGGAQDGTLWEVPDGEWSIKFAMPTDVPAFSDEYPLEPFREVNRHIHRGWRLTENGVARVFWVVGPDVQE